ncbi:MAG: hypothetical protein EBR82_17430 [Caulobacteraceae bacterium]|nr:hypothetical protein [Caulobacteraceae bacterium]
MDEDQKKIETLKAKYDKEIAELIKLEAKKVKGATDARLQLEQQKEDAVDALLDEIQQKRTAKDEENLQKLLDKATEAANADLEAKQAFQQQLDDFTLTEYEKALLELDKHHSDLLALAEKYHRDDSVIEEAYQKQKSELAKQYADKQNKELVETEKKKYETIAQAYQGYAAVLGGAIQGLDAILGQHTAASKVLALAQIAFKTAEAIASGIAASAGVPFPGNLVAIGTTVATVLGNFAAAKKIFNDAPSIPQKYTGGFFDVTGETDGRAYNAQYIGSPGTGLLPNRPVVLASEHGAEYFVANQDLRNPVVLNYVRAIENIRAARTGSVPQFAEGGLSNTPGTDTTSATLLAVMVQFLPLLQQLNTALSSGIKAEIEDDTVIGINNRFKLLNRASGGVL